MRSACGSARLFSGQGRKAMPTVLMLRLEAPLIAFGDVMVDGRGPILDLPSTSMLTGLIANALGWERLDWQSHQRLQDRLLHAARLDRSSHRFTEFQTVQLARNDQAWTTRGLPEGRSGSADTYDSPHLRYREHDADLVAFVAMTLRDEHEYPTLDDISAALDQPARPLFIGRKHCLPTSPICAGLIEAENLLSALKAFPLHRYQARNAENILVELPEAADRPEDFRRTHRYDLRDWRAGVLMGESIRWSGWISVDCFVEGAWR